MPLFESPVGEQIDRNMGKVWPPSWHDANEYGERYTVKGGMEALHTGADLNRRRGDDNAPVFAMGDGIVTFARLFSKTAWGNIIIIDHGVVDGRVLFSRYGHVQRIAVQEDTKVLKGQHIAGVGNGGPGLNFDPHLHFDISTTSVLKRHPGFWPGLDEKLLKHHFVNPKDWLEAPHVLGTRPAQRTPLDRVITSTDELQYFAQLDGVKICDNYGTSAKVVYELQKGADLMLMKKVGRLADGFVWGKISGGVFNGYWVAVCKDDNTMFNFAIQKPAGIVGTTPPSATGAVKYYAQLDGVKVQEDHSISAKVVCILKKGAEVSIMQKEGKPQDGFIWGRIRGGVFDGRWVAVCTDNGTVFNFAMQKPS
jgi:hypothetical protein